MIFYTHELIKKFIAIVGKQVDEVYENEENPSSSLSEKYNLKPDYESTLKELERISNTNKSIGHKLRAMYRNIQAYWNKCLSTDHKAITNAVQDLLLEALDLTNKVNAQNLNTLFTDKIETIESKDIIKLQEQIKPILSSKIATKLANISLSENTTQSSSNNNITPSTVKPNPSSASYKLDTLLNKAEINIEQFYNKLQKRYFKINFTFKNAEEINDFRNLLLKSFKIDNRYLPGEPRQARKINVNIEQDLYHITLTIDEVLKFKGYTNNWTIKFIIKFQFKEQNQELLQELLQDENQKRVQQQVHEQLTKWILDSSIQQQEQYQTQPTAYKMY